jgi:hypothetical protein
MIFEKERKRLSVVYTGYQMIFEKERERETFVLYTGYKTESLPLSLFQTSPGNLYAKPKVSLSLFQTSPGNQ